MHALGTEAFSFDWWFPVAFIWGLLVIASFAGWGQAVCRCLVSGGGEQAIGWGMSAAWGMATFLVISGPVILLSLFGTVYVVVFLATGLFFGINHLLRKRRREPASVAHPNFGLKIALVILGFFILLSYTGAVAMRWYDPFDDYAAYFYLAKRLLDTGTLFEPFNWRMLGALGGQPALSTLVLAFLPWKFAHLLDAGIAGLIVLGLMLEFVRGGDSRAWIARILLLALALVFTMPRSNTASEYTGVVLFMALLQAFDYAASGRTKGWRSAIFIGGIGTAAITLRCHNIFAVGLMAAGFAALRYWEKENDRPKVIRETLMMAATTLAMLTPWWIVAYKSGKTFLFPLVNGNHSPDFDILFGEHLGFWGVLGYIILFFIAMNYLTFFVPLFFLEPDAQMRRLAVSAIALLIVSVAFLCKYDHELAMRIHAFRYLAPFVFAFFLYTAGLAARRFVVASPDVAFKAGLARLQWRLAPMVAIILILLELVPFLGSSIVNVIYIYRATNAHTEMWADIGGLRFRDETRQEYGAAFSRIPPGEKVFIAVDYPFLLDNRTHALFSADVAGATSPAPGLPYFQGGREVEQYLRDQGFHYIAHVPFERSQFLFGRSTALRELSIPGGFFQTVGKYKLDFVNNIDDLEKSKVIIYDSPSIRVSEL